jgi:polysaccharide export outer membrane protein
VIAFFVVSTMGLCVLGQTKPPSPAATPEKNEAPKAMPGTPGDATAALPIDPKTYVIGPEDVLHVDVWREAQFTRPAGVRPDGKITMPMIGDIQAAGLTPERLAAQLKQGLAELIRNPEVTVTVVQVNSKRFTIQGEVNRPGVFPLITPIKIFDALGQAGGFRDFANKKNIIIIRGSTRLKFNWNDVLKGKKMEQNVFVEPGDVIVVK